MPNEINPNNYNIDFFSTNFIGTVNAGSFRDYLFSKNLQELPPELINGAAGNFSSEYDEKGLEKEINYTSILNPGDVDEWFVEGNFSTNVHQVRDIGMLQGNTYGPPTISAYNAPELIPEDTGFLQYPTSSGGNDFREFLLSDQLGFGPGAAVNFPSELQDIGKERRKEEAFSRLRTNVVDNTVGKLNLDPFGLLAGQDLILKDYKITVFPSIVGKIVDFATDALGVQIPVSPIPKGAFGTWGTDDDSESYKSLMNATGSGTKSLIYNAVSVNKYGPTLSEPVGRLANLFGAGQPPQLNTYLTNTNETIQANIREQEEKPLVDKINQAVGKFVNNLASGFGVGKEERDLSPYEFEKPSVEVDPIQSNNNIGFDSLSNGSFNDTWALAGPTDKITLPDGKGGSFTIPMQGADAPIGTKIPFVDDDWLGGGKANNGTLNQGKPYDKGMYWGSHSVNPFRRGILKYTQDLVNNSKESNQKDKSRFIGVVNDPLNYDEKSGRHNKYSMGNTVTSKDNSFYCRSWSVRNPYRKVSDLIRHGVSGSTASLTRPDYNLSVLGSNGFVKVAPYVEEPSDSGLDGSVLKLGNPSIQKYMLSIENLAWQNSEHLLYLPKCEVGPNGGRIMWFPPYDISFTDNSSVNWDSTTFIGRGEPIYTYNSTERTGTLSFKMIIDHSLAVAKIKQQGEEALFRYFAGCEDPVEAARDFTPPASLEDVRVERIVTTPRETVNEQTEEVNVTTPVEPPITQVQFFFRNARYFENDTVGTNLLTELSVNANEQPPNYLNNYTKKWPNGYLRGLSTTPPAVLPDPSNPNTFVPNPAFTANTQNNLDTLNDIAVNDWDKLVDFLLTPDGKRYRIKIVGKTSDAGPNKGTKSNLELGQKRANTTKEYLLNTLYAVETTVGSIKAENLGSDSTYPTEKEWRDSDLRWQISTTGEEGANLSISTDTSNGTRSTSTDDNRIFGDSDATVPEALLNRTTVITLEYNPEIDATFVGPAKLPTDTSFDTTKVYDIEKQEKNKQKLAQEEVAAKLAAIAKEYMAWECSYFHKMGKDDPFIYETLQEKLKYFHPAFHSMTPEGFNSRLTFLKQCTRQGPNVKANEPSNMAFGKPPICVLRIGDFYHTKIVIDSVNLSFDPLQWDLNPEGAGVQPMLCNVDLNFKFIGGSSLGGPISQLQNAVGFNFFANTALYQPRTIYKSTKKYKVERPDPITGLVTEISNVETINSGEETFEFGAYVSPQQANFFKGSQVSNTETPPPDNSNSINKNNQTNITPKEATPSENLTKSIENSFNETANKEIATVNDVSTTGDTNTVELKSNDENKTMPGFDKTTGRYITQYDQVLTWKGFSNNETQTWKKLKIPKGTKVFTDNDTDGRRVVFIGKVINTGNNTTFSNKVLLNCNDFGKGLHFTVKPVSGLQENPGGSGAYYTNSALYNVIKPIFCKGTTVKTWKELVS